jgi:cytoskeletal protein RodZ
MQDVQQPGTSGPQAPQQAAGRPNVARMPNRMPKAQAHRIASGLKKGVLVASVALFGGFAALVAGNVVGVTASSSSSSSSDSSSSSSSSDSSSNSTQNSDQNNSTFFGGGSSGSVGSGSSSQQPSQVTSAS